MGSERDARLPRTPTGNNLLGLLKHCLNVEAGYFGPTFGREFQAPHELVPMEAVDTTGGHMSPSSPRWPLTSQPALID